MISLSRLKVVLAILLLLILAVGMAGHRYFQTTQNIDENVPFTSYEKATFPDWAYCDRGIEYDWNGENPAPFRDRQGVLIEGEQEIPVRIRGERIQDRSVEVVEIARAKAKVSLVKGVPEGMARVFHENGRVAFECAYRQGLRNGICKSYASDGWLMNEVEYSGGKKTGIFRAYRPDGAVLSEGNSESCQEYAILGQVPVKKVSRDKAETFGCTPNRKETIYDDQDTVRQEYRGFARDGHLAQTATLQEHFLGPGRSLVRSMMVNGKISRRETFSNGLRIVQDFDSSGVLRSQVCDRGGVLEGGARWFDGKGRLRREGRYRSNLRDGIFEWYGPDGKIIWTAFYERGELYGERLLYSVLSGVVFLIAQALVFLLSVPIFNWLRPASSSKALLFLIRAVLAAGLFILAAYLAYLAMFAFYS